MTRWYCDECEERNNPQYYWEEMPFGKHTGSHAHLCAGCDEAMLDLVKDELEARGFAVYNSDGKANLIHALLEDRKINVH